MIHVLLSTFTIKTKVQLLICPQNVFCLTFGVHIKCADIVLRFFQYLSRDKQIRLMQKIVLKLVTLILMCCTLTFNLKGADLPRTLSADAHMSTW